jgi:hypothetical protein
MQDYLQRYNLDYYFDLRMSRPVQCQNAVEQHERAVLRAQLDIRLTRPNRHPSRIRAPQGHHTRLVSWLNNVLASSFPAFSRRDYFRCRRRWRTGRSIIIHCRDHSILEVLHRHRRILPFCCCTATKRLRANCRSHCR